MTTHQCHTTKNSCFKKADGVSDGAYLNGMVACKIIWILYGVRYLPCCTTKYIFWLGKNKFD